MSCGRECDCESEEAHDAVVERDAVYWRSYFADMPRRERDHECSGAHLRCDECGAQLTGEALDDSIARMEAA